MVYRSTFKVDCTRSTLIIKDLVIYFTSCSIIDTNCWLFCEKIYLYGKYDSLMLCICFHAIVRNHIVRTKQLGLRQRGE